jgi:hypothetical protein
MKVWSSEPTTFTPLLGFVADPFSPSGAQPVFAPEQRIEGFRLVDSRASYGIGLETFALGFPIHFDWSWRTLFNRQWEDALFAFRAIQDGDTSGSEWLRKVKFSLWIGYDF